MAASTLGGVSPSSPSYYDLCPGGGSILKKAGQSGGGSKPSTSHSCSRSPIIGTTLGKFLLAAKNKQAARCNPDLKMLLGDAVSPPENKELKKKV